MAIEVRHRRNGKLIIWTTEKLRQYVNEGRVGRHKVGYAWADSQLILAASGKKSMSAVLKEATQ